MPKKTTPRTAQPAPADQSIQASSRPNSFMAGGGQIGHAMRAYDWSATSLGPPSTWPENLKTIINIMLNSSFPMFVWWGKDELINFYNDAYLVILGDKQNALGASAPTIWPEIWDDITPMVNKVFQDGQPVYMKDLLLQVKRTKQAAQSNDGEEAYFTFSYSPVQAVDGTIAGLYCVVSETTEEVKNRRDMIESRAKLEAIFESVVDGVGVFDTSGNLVLCNDALAKLNDYPDKATMQRQANIDKPHYSLSYPDQTEVPRGELPVSRALRGESFSDLELRAFREGSDKQQFFSFSGSPIRDSDGKLILAVTVTRDISRRKKAEAKLRESEFRFRSLADTAPMYIAMADDQGNAVYFNKPWLEFTGKDLEEMKGLGWLNTLHPEDAPKFEKDFKDAFRRRTTINRQYRFKRADGEYRWMLAVGAPRFTPEGQFIGYYGTYTDFHDLKMAQLAVQESEERFRTVANNISQLVWTTDAEGNAKWYNQRWYDYTGTTFAETKKFGWQKLHSPKYVAKVTAKFKASLQAGTVWEDTFPLKGKDGNYRWFLSRAIPIRDEAGKIVEWFGTNTDIDELRRTTQQKSKLEHVTAALREQQAQLLALNQAKDEFISLASHQLRTPATGVKQFIGMLLEGYAGELDESQRRFLQTAYESNERQLKIVNDLLRVARVDSGKMRLQVEGVDVGALIQEVIDEQSAQFAASEQTVHFTPPSLPLTVSVDAALFRMALENIIDNAHKYTFPDKNIFISVTSDGSSVRIAVQDEGTGIAQADINKLFHKFSRIDNPLSATAGGTGLGLYWVKRVIDLHGGTIEATSELGVGTTFTICLPV